MKTVCFAGFDKPQAVYLKALAEEKGYQVVDAVIPALSLLVVGGEPDTGMVKDAGDNGVDSVDLAGFWNFLEVERADG